eukprot:6181665-Pleurochrysis_carterae.AAC.1
MRCKQRGRMIQVKLRACRWTVRVGLGRGGAVPAGLTCLNEAAAGSPAVAWPSSRTCARARRRKVGGGRHEAAEMSGHVNTEAAADEVQREGEAER